jgi:DNA mismatch repair ATPase MutS
MYGTGQCPSNQKRTVSDLSREKLALLNLFNDSHPLVEQLADIFVPNDAHLVGGRGQVLGEEKEAATSEIDFPQRTDEDGAYSIAICTGANACGKACGYIQRYVRLLMGIREQSVYLKQVG